MPKWTIEVNETRVHRVVYIVDGEDTTDAMNNAMVGYTLDEVEMANIPNVIARVIEPNTLSRMRKAESD